MGDCWIGLSLADSSGLILAARVGKHTDELIDELVVSTEGKTACKRWNSDDWGGDERVLPPEIFTTSCCYFGANPLSRKTAARIRHNDVRAHQWHRQATDWKMAS